MLKITITLTSYELSNLFSTCWLTSRRSGSLQSFWSKIQISIKWILLQTQLQSNNSWKGWRPPQATFTHLRSLQIALETARINSFRSDYATPLRNPSRSIQRENSCNDSFWSAASKLNLHSASQLRLNFVEPASIRRGFHPRWLISSPKPTMRVRGRKNSRAQFDARCPGCWIPNSSFN